MRGSGAAVLTAALTVRAGISNVVMVAGAQHRFSGLRKHACGVTEVFLRVSKHRSAYSLMSAWCAQQCTFGK